MEALLSLSGIIGAICCVGMYAAVSFGRESAECPRFFAVNAVGAALILIGAGHQFDVGDLGSIGQEVVWAILSVIGCVRARQRQNSGQ
jgi:hypothetical protein